MPSNVPGVIVAAPEEKSLLSSKTVWFNVVLAIFAVLESQLKLLEPLVPVNAYALLTFIAVMGNAVLRVFLTTQAIRLPGAAPATLPEIPDTGAIKDMVAWAAKGSRTVLWGSPTHDATPNNPPASVAPSAPAGQSADPGAEGWTGRGQ